MGERGPAPFDPTIAQRNLVKLLIAGGLSEPVIAHRLGICQMTLRKHFRDELTFGRGLKIAENLARLDKAAKAGNVTAMKHLDAKFELVSAKGSFIDEPVTTSHASKKEQVRSEAMTAGRGSEWGDDLKPPNDLPN